MKQNVALLIDVLSENPDVDVIVIDETLKSVHEAMHGAFVDTFYFQLPYNETVYCALVDDCGRIKGLPISAVYDDEKTVALVGNIVITKIDGQGETLDLDELDVISLANNLFTAVDKKTGRIYPVLGNIRKGVTWKH